MKDNLFVDYKNSYVRLSLLILSSTIILLMLNGCAGVSNSVIAATGTTIGVEISQNQTTQTPMGVLGYKRAELAYVPTNRSSNTEETTNHESKSSTGSGARDSANVLMELRYKGIFDWSADSGIYQRLAVGDIAVTQPGANLVFAKNASGDITDEVARAISVVRGIPAVNWEVESIKTSLKEAYDKCKNIPSELSKFDIAAKSQGFSNFREFIGNLNVAKGKADAIEESLDSQSVNCN